MPAEIHPSILEITEQVFILPGSVSRYPEQGLVYIAMPESYADQTSIPFVVAVHGSKRGALDYRDNAFYRAQRDIALRHGCLFAAVSNSYDTWGLDSGLHNVILLVEYLMEHYPVQKQAILWASSAGGVLANRMVMEYPEKVAFVLGTFPVYDLCSVFALDNCKKAWGTKCFLEFRKRIEGRNPADHPDTLRKHHFYITHGSNDTAVPIDANALKMKADLGSHVCLEIIDGGTHGTANFDFYGRAVNTAFQNHLMTI